MLTHRSRSTRSSSRAGVARGASRGLISVLSFGIPLFALAQSLTSCGSDDDGDQVCEPGTPRACALPGNSCDAIQECLANGSGYTACACPGDTGNAGAGGSGAGAGGSANNAGGAAGAGGDDLQPIFPVAARAVGAPCASDADCPVGPNGETPLTCITAGGTEPFGTGGPQDGYCSATCRDTDECLAIDPLAGCAGIDPQTGEGFCLGVCTPAGGNIACFIDEPRAQACIPSPDDPTFGACLPMCQSDAACGAGLFCDFGRQGIGLCTATAPTGGDIGAPCTVETEATDCKSGLCLNVTDPATGEAAGSFCSASCTFGLVAGCGSDDSTPLPLPAACGQSRIANGTLGDPGICIELCSEDADCAQAAAGWTCQPGLTPQGQQLTGQTGQCLPFAVPGDDTPAPDAGTP
jgi:hypothetical protein